MPEATPTCSCCGQSRQPTELTSLRCKPDVRVCPACIHWLATAAGAVHAIPIFATADMDASRRFYEAAGFHVLAYDEGYSFVNRGGGEVLHLARSAELDPARNAAACYLNTREADEWHAAWAGAGLPVSDIADRPWGMHEFEVRDPSGNLLRVGRNLP